MDNEEEDGETITLFGGAKLETVEQEGQSCEKAATIPAYCGHALSQPHFTTPKNMKSLLKIDNLWCGRSRLYIPILNEYKAERNSEVQRLHPTPHPQMYIVYVEKLKLGSSIGIDVKHIKETSGYRKDKGPCLYIAHCECT